MQIEVGEAIYKKLNDDYMNSLTVQWEKYKDKKNISVECLRLGQENMAIKQQSIRYQLEAQEERNIR